MIFKMLFTISLLYTSSTGETILSNNNHDRPNHQKRTGVKSDFSGTLSAHDLWDEINTDSNWAGASTLSDGSHNPNEIVGWGAASASAWTQSGTHTGGDNKDDKPKPQPQGQGQGQGQQQMQTPMQQPGGYTGYTGGYTMPQYGYQQPSYGTGTGTSTSTGYSTGYSGYSPSTGYGNDNAQTGYSSSGFGYQQPSTGYGTGYDPSGGYTATGFGYQQPSTGYGTGYNGAATGTMPGGQQPMGAPQQTDQQSQNGGGVMGVPGAKKPMQGGQSQSQGQGQGQMGGVGMQGGNVDTVSTSSDKCPLPHRHRKPWALMSDEQKDIFIDGFQQVRKNGKLDVIAQTHAQHDVQNYVHYTSLFTFYHAYLVWELETAIRDLGGKFSCFTMPYYDWTLDAGKEDNPEILHSGLGTDGDPDNNYCVQDDDSGFTWQTCKDYTPWRTVTSTNNNNDDADVADGDDNESMQGKNIFDDEHGIIYNEYDEDDDIFKPHYIDYGEAYESFDPRDDDDDPVSIVDQPAQDEFADDEIDGDDVLEQESGLVAEEVEESCFWTQANCKSDEQYPFCCLKRKKSTTILLPTASEIGDAMYRSKNIKEWQGYLGEYYNKVQALFGADYYAHMSNGYATEDPIFWMTHSFIIHLRSLWQDCWNYNNIPKDKLDMHYNSYHPYCGTFDAIPSTCGNYNLALDAPMNFYELQKSEWSLAYHKIVTVRKMWTPEYWNVVYELGPFYSTSGIKNWCDNTRDSEWFLETMDYDVDAVNTPINIFSQRLWTTMMKDGVEMSGIFKTVSALSCQYNRRYSLQSCWEDSMLEMQLQVETCDADMTNGMTSNMTLEEMLGYEGVAENECLKKIRRQSFAYSEHALQVKKQLCKGDWDYTCPEYNELLYSDYASVLENPIDISGGKRRKSRFAKSGWIWMIVINGILVCVVAVGCGVWHCSRSKTVSIPLLGDEEDIIDDDGVNEYATIQVVHDNEEYQPLLV